MFQSSAGQVLFWAGATSVMPFSLASLSWCCARIEYFAGCDRSARGRSTWISHGAMSRRICICGKCAPLPIRSETVFRTSGIF